MNHLLAAHVIYILIYPRMAYIHSIYMYADKYLQFLAITVLHL